MLTYAIAERFHAKGENGHYMALCPAHNDNNPSLSITAKDRSNTDTLFCRV